MVGQKEMDFRLIQMRNFKVRNVCGSRRSKGTVRLLGVSSRMVWKKQGRTRYFVELVVAESERVGHEKSLQILTTRAATQLQPGRYQSHSHNRFEQSALMSRRTKQLLQSSIS